MLVDTPRARRTACTKDTAGLRRRGLGDLPDLRIRVLFAEGNRRVHAPHFTEIKEKVETYVEALLTGRGDKPYVDYSIDASGSYGYSFVV